MKWLISKSFSFSFNPPPPGTLSSLNHICIKNERKMIYHPLLSSQFIFSISKVFVELSAEGKKKGKRGLPVTVIQNHPYEQEPPPPLKKKRPHRKAKKKTAPKHQTPKTKNKTRQRKQVFFFFSLFLEAGSTGNNLQHIVNDTFQLVNASPQHPVLLSNDFRVAAAPHACLSVAAEGCGKPPL